MRFVRGINHHKPFHLNYTAFLLPAGDGGASANRNGSAFVPLPVIVNSPTSQPRRSVRHSESARGGAPGQRSSTWWHVSGSGLAASNTGSPADSTTGATRRERLTVARVGATLGRDKHKGDLMHVGMATVFQNPQKSRTDREVYRQELRLADLAEPLGFESIWGVEHHFTDYTMCPDVLQFLTYMAGRTARAQLGSMVVVLPWHDPMRVAEEVSMLDNISDGRLILGLGRGAGKVEFDGFRLPMDESRDRFVESAEMLLRGLESGYCEYDGKFIKQIGKLAKDEKEFFLKLIFELQIIFDDSVMDNYDFAGAIAMRVRVFFGGAPVGGPARVADAVSAVERAETNCLFEIAQFSLSAADLEFVTFTDDGDAG